MLAINGLAYLVYSLWIRHLQKDIWPTRADIRAIPRSILDHIKLKHPTGEAARRYNVLQKLAYLGVILADHPDGADGAHHVAGIQCLLPLDAGSVRRPAVGAQPSISSVPR